MIRFFILWFPFLVWCVPFDHPIRGPIEPHLSGDTFRAYCDHAYDELSRIFLPSRVRDGQTVFVNADQLGEFFQKYHPLIHAKYILVTHNSDQPIPGPYRIYLEDEKIIVWFGQNVEKTHPKLHALPIGLENRQWKPQNVETIAQVREAHLPKIHLLYCNFSTTSYPLERPMVYALLAHAPFTFEQPRKDFIRYLEDIASSKFVLSPRGNGLDTHRLWEALYVGSYPIVKTSGLDDLYANLPIVIVSNWNEVTENFLNQKYEEFQGKTFQMKKLYTNFWFHWINTFKREFQN